jgi:hypothetical protein
VHTLILSTLSIALALGGAALTISPRTTRRRYQAGRQAALAAVPERARRRLWVPVPGEHCRYRLTVVIGQADGRLRVISAPVTIARLGPVAAPGGTVFTPPYPWPRWTT